MDKDLVMATVRLHTHMHCYIYNATGEEKKKSAEQTLLLSDSTYLQYRIVFSNTFQLFT